MTKKRKLEELHAPRQEGLQPSLDPQSTKTKDLPLEHHLISTETWAAELQGLANLAGVSLKGESQELLAGKPLQVNENEVGSDAAFDYALKRVIRGLQEKGKLLEDRIQECKSWILIHELLRRCSVGCIARVIGETKFMSLLESVLVWLQDEASAGLETTYTKNPHLTSDARDESEENGGSSEDSNEGLISYARLGTLRLDRCILLISISRVIEQLVNLTEVSSPNVRSYAVAQLKHALRISSESAAIILGSIFFLASLAHRSQQVEASSNGVHSPGESRDLDVFESNTPVFAASRLWKLVTSQQLLTKPLDVHQAFSDTGLIPTALLLDVYIKRVDAELTSSSGNDVVRILRKLLGDHVFLPYRQMCFEKNRPGHNHPDRMSAIVGYGWKGLTSGNFSKRLEEPVDDNKKLRRLCINLLTLLFREAVQACPRHSAKLRKAEGPWLDKVFLDIMTIADKVNQYHAEDRGMKPWKRLIVNMLQVCKAETVGLSTETCERLLADYTGLLGQDDQEIEWNVLGRCIEMDGDLFVQGRPGPYPLEASDGYLKVLFNAVNTRPSAVQGELDRVSNLTLVPLFRAFAHARQIPRFIELWRQQLQEPIISINEESSENTATASESKESEQKLDETTTKPQSIWTHDGLIFVVSRHTESLTPLQIQEIIASSEIEPWNVTRKTLAAITILDALLRGVVLQDTIAELADQVAALYEGLTQVIQCSEWLRNDEWILWHLQTVIAHRWLPIDDKRQSARTYLLFDQAMEVLRSFAQRDAAVPYSRRYRAYFQAFAFLLSLQPDIESTGQRPDNYDEIVEPVFSLMEDFCQMARDGGDNDPSPRTVSDNPQFLPAGPINSKEELYIGCMWQLLRNQEILNSLPYSTKSMLLEQTYICARSYQHDSKVSATKTIDFAKLWKELIMALSETGDNETQYLVASFLCDKYMYASEIDDRGNYDLDGPDYRMAYSSLRISQPDLWTVSHRSQVVGRIREVLDSNEIKNESLFMGHIILLSKIWKGCTESMDISTTKFVHAWVENQSFPIGFSPTMGIAVAQLARTYASDMLCGPRTQALESDPMEFAMKKSRFKRRLFGILAGLRIATHSDFEASEALSHIMAIELLVTTGLVQDKSDPSKHCSEDLQQAFFEAVLRRIDYIIDRPEKKTGIERPVNAIELLQFDIVYLAKIYRLRFSTDFDGRLKTSLSRLFMLLISQPHKLHGISADQYSRLAVDVARARLVMMGDGGEKVPLILEVVEMLNSANNVESIATLEPFEVAGAVEQSLREPRRKFVAPQDRNRLLKYIQQATSSLSGPQRETLLRKVCHDTKRQYNDASLYIIRSTILSSSKDQNASVPTTAFDYLQDFFSTSHPFSSTILAFQCIAALLSKQSRLITQHQVETTLVYVIRFSQPDYLMQFPLKQSAHITTALTRLLQTLLRVHRIRLKGRFHILVLALTALLHSLFTPYPSSPSAPELPTAITTAHASSYARLLTTICDPSVSAVSRKPRPTSTSNAKTTTPALHLNDETKKAKREAGAYMIDWVQKYCAFHQHGKLGLEVRKALMPGVWAVLDVVAIEPERVKALSERMGESERGVFRGVWAEWQRRRAGGEGRRGV